MDAGYEVITVNNGAAALKKIHEKQPDLIVLDVYMPGYGGLEVCQRLKESAETQKIPVLLTVGKMEPFKPDEAKRVRADGHIVKPFEASELLAALTKLEDRIVPQAERSRAKKSKSEKKARFWHAADPATTFDDSNTESIAYLTEVKERQSRDDEDEDTPATESNEARSAKTMPAAAAPESSLVPQAAAELPVIAEASPAAPQEFTIPQPAESAAVEVRSPSENVAPIPESPKVADAAEGELQPPDPQPVTPAESAEVAVRADSKLATRWVAENVPLTAEEASQSLDQEMKRRQEKASVATDPAKTETARTPSAPVEAPAESTEKNGASFAAAASASSSAVASSAVSEPDPERQNVSEAAAAWQNWQQIRDSVMSPQSTEAVANSIVEAAQATDVSPAPSVPTDTASTTEDPSNPALEGAALASIVDSVLAELKPKLMEEIAKKLKK
jgi:CheY-like chemotaxis protein